GGGLPRRLLLATPACGRAKRGGPSSVGRRAGKAGTPPMRHSKRCLRGPPRFGGEAWRAFELWPARRQSRHASDEASQAMPLRPAAGSYVPGYRMEGSLDSALMAKTRVGINGFGRIGRNF